MVVLVVSCGSTPATTSGPSSGAATAAPAEQPAATAATGTGAATAAPAEQPAATAATGTGAATAAPAASNEPVTLRIMHWTTNQVEDSPWWKEILDGFTAAHPNVTIENNYVAFPQYLPSLEAQAASNSLPDVFYASVKAAELGRSGNTINYKDVMPAEFFDQFYPSPLKQYTFDDGKVYAVPWTAQTFGLFANNKLMQDLNLKAPETWDDLIAMAPKMREAGLTPVSFGNQAKNVCPDFFLPLITQYGGDVYALDDLTQAGLSWNSEPVVNALKLLKRLADAKVFPEGINGITQDQGVQIWYQGKALMLFAGSWQPPSIAEEAPPELAANYSLVKNPALKQGDKHWTADGSGEGWAINAKSPNKDLALEFVKYLFSADVYNKATKAAQHMPSMPSALSQIDDKGVQTMTTWLEEGADHILFGKGNWDAVSNVCQSILDGSIEPEAGAAQIQKDIEAARGH
jgi:ABC-type glycerol-3-phosphate transport system substrate-binding protein